MPATEPESPVEGIVRTAIYTRTNPGEDITDDQQEACSAYAQSQSWNLVQTYHDEATKGDTLHRPGLKKLLRSIARGELDGVVVEQLHRLSTSVADFARLLDLFQQHNVTFACVRPALNTGDSVGRLLMNVLLSLDQFESEFQSEFLPRNDV